MIKIAVLDDEKSMCDLLCKAAVKAVSDLCECRTCAFQNARSFLQTHEFYDILLLDIDMPGTNGLELAEMLRQQQIHTIIIFVTSQIRFLKNAYGLNVFGFIDKRDLDAELPQSLKKCVEYIKKRIGFTFKTNNGFIKLLSDDIIFAEYLDRKVKIYTKNENYVVNLYTIHDFYEIVKDNDFIYVNRSMVVNLLYLANITKTGAQLIGVKRIIPVSRIDETQKYFLSYISKRGIV